MTAQDQYAAHNVIKELRESRERAIRWAVTLENQLAAVEALLPTWDKRIREFKMVASGMSAVLASAATRDCADELRAALTGSTE